MSTMSFLFRCFCLAFAGLFFLCGCDKDSRVLRIGIDRGWYPLDFSRQQKYVNGYIDELLLEIAN